MPSKRLAVICGLTLADYLLWNWSVSGNHDVVAIVSGVTLPFLVLASAVLLVLSLARLISGYVRPTQPQVARPRPGASESTEHRARRSIKVARRPRRAGGSATSPAADPTSGSVPSASASPASSPRRRAA